MEPQKLPTLTAAKLRRYKKQTGRTNAEMAAAFGVSLRTMKYWLAGRPIPRNAALLFFLLPMLESEK